LPVLLVTGDETNQKKAMAAGAVDLLLKPFTTDEFRSWFLEKSGFGQPVKNM
jgi:CheY-like chemotaxis protein